ATAGELGRPTALADQQVQSSRHDRQLQLAEDLVLRSHQTRRGNLRYGTVHLVRTREIDGDERGQFGDDVGRDLSAVDRPRLHHGISGRGLVDVREDMVVAQDMNLAPFLNQAADGSRRDLEMSHGYSAGRRAEPALERKGFDFPNFDDAGPNTV